MNDQEKFQKTFDKLHASPQVLTEVLEMADNQKQHVKKFHFSPKAAAAAAAVILVLGSGGAAYATDLGGIQSLMKIWIYGDQVDANFTYEDGSYTLAYIDAEGNEQIQEGGGIVYETDGTERAMTADELLAMVEKFTQPDVEYRDDGTVWVYYQDQILDITDQFEDNVCYVELDSQGEPLYLTVKYEEGFATDSEGYPSPEDFN